MKTLILTATALAALAAAAAAASGTVQPAPTLTIRHQTVGCHSWSLNGGSYRVGQTVRLREGQSLRVVNRDSHTHRLVQLSGGSLAYTAEPQLPLRGPASAAMPLPPDPDAPAAAAASDGTLGSKGASVLVTFHEAGTYVLTTAAGDAFAGAEIASNGPDNTLILRVLVFPLLHHPLP
jgi:plastocyanin